MRPAAAAPQVTASPTQIRYGHFSGQPLGPGSGIRLVISNGPAGLAPAILNVDTSASTPISGLPSPDPRLTLSTLAYGRHAVITVSGLTINQERLYLLKGNEARKLGTGWYAFPAFDDSGFWIVDQPVYGGLCTVRKQTENGRMLRRPRWSYCGALPFADTPYGLHMRYRRESILLTHDSLRKTTRYPQIVAATSQELLVKQPGKNLALVIPGTEKERTIGRPTRGGETEDGEVSPDGRYIAVPFLTPTTGAYDYLDVWVLDTKTLKWIHLPSMPVPVDGKTRRMRWIPNGQLVLAGSFVTTTDPYPLESDYASMIATWRPGEQALSIRRLPVNWETDLEIIP